MPLESGGGGGGQWREMLQSLGKWGRSVVACVGAAAGPGGPLIIWAGLVVVFYLDRVVNCIGGIY